MYLYKPMSFNSYSNSVLFMVTNFSSPMIFIKNLYVNIYRFTCSLEADLTITTMLLLAFRIVTNGAGTVSENGNVFLH